MLTWRPSITSCFGSIAVHLELEHERSLENGVQLVLPRVGRTDHQLGSARGQCPEALVARSWNSIRVDHFDEGDDVEIGLERRLVLVQPLKAFFYREVADHRDGECAGRVD